MSKLTTNLSILFSFALLMLTGCEQNTAEVLPPQGEEPAEVLFSARIADVQISTRTNYTEKTGFALNDKIGLFAWKEENTSESAYIENSLLVSNAGGSELTAPGQKIYFPYQATVLGLYAYSPYSNTTVSNNLVNIQSELENIEGYIKDPLWAKTTIQKTDNPKKATFNFSHRMARLKIYVYKDAEVTDDYNLKSIQVTFYNKQTGILNIVTGAITSSDATEITYTDRYETGTLSTENSGNAQYDHTILPADAISGNSTVKRIVIKVSKTGETPASYEIYHAEANENTTFIKPSYGKVIRINVKFNPSTTASASLGAWQTDEELHM